MSGYFSRFFPGPRSPLIVVPVIVLPNYDPTTRDNHPGHRWAQLRRMDPRARCRYTTTGEWGIGDVRQTQDTLDALAERFPIRETPARTGRLLLEQYWARELRVPFYLDYRPLNEPPRWVRRPGNRANLLLHGQIVGGREHAVEVEQEDDVILDEPGSYVQHFGRLPSGTPVRYLPGWSDGGWRHVTGTFAAPATITEPDIQLPLLPHVGTTADGRSARRWKRSPYAEPVRSLVLWKEEAQEAERLGYRVEWSDAGGWLWPEWTVTTQPWCDLMLEQRELARPVPLEYRAIKRIYSATVASFRCYHRERVVRDSAEADRGSRLVGPRGAWTRYERPERQNMVHWYSWLMAQIRLHVYRAALPYAGHGLVSIHTDSLHIRAGMVRQIPDGFEVRVGRDTREILPDWELVRIYEGVS